MSERRTNQNAARKAQLSEPGEWVNWSGNEVEKYIRFIETYCHEPDEAGELLTMFPYQRDLIALWLDEGTHAAMCKMPRGNAKSTTTAAFAVAHLFLRRGADIPVVATTLSQAVKTVYGRMVRMVQMSPELAQRCIVRGNNNAPKLEVPSNYAQAYPIADKPAGLMGLNPSLAILDEASESSLATWNALLGAAGKRGEGGSKTIAISTPSLNFPDNALQRLEQAYKSGVAMPGFVFTEYSAPDGCALDDEEAWSVANPALHTDPPILTKKFIYTQLAGMTEAEFRCYRLAQWVEGGEEGWLGVSAGTVWDSIEAEYEFVEDAPTWVGVDYAREFDTTAVVYCQEKPDGILHFKCKVWKPTELGGIDLNQVGFFLHELHNKYDLVAVSYDPHGLQFLAEHLENEGLPMVEIKQTKEYMLPAVMNTRTAIFDGLVTHDKDEVFRTQVLNANPHYYGSEGFTLKKRKENPGKIDAAVAMCLAHHAYKLLPYVADFRIISL